VRTPVTLATLLVVCAAAASAQSNRGSGISGGALSEHVSVDFVREHWGPPDSVRLAAAVLWRGNSDWALSHGPAESARARAAMDSAARDANRRGVQAGGTITVAGNAWVEYNDRARTLSVLQRTYMVPASDSTLVLLVDRVDHIGGEPLVASMVLACNTEPDATRTPDADGRHDMIAGMRKMSDHWRTCLLRDSVVRAFVERPPTR
jgi:hypothetical protein